jgi:hypothetical protein
MRPRNDRAGSASQCDLYFTAQKNVMSFFAAKRYMETCGNN